jgi:hypothetical protein
MKVSGYTFIRNGTKLGYPYIQSILSVLPICDEFVIAVGVGEDDTLAQLQSIPSDKIRIIQTTWNEKMKDRGFVYAQQKMIAQYNCTGDWAFYLEGDEIIHEKDLQTIKIAMQTHLDNPDIEAIAFNYYHFFGSPDWLATGPGWYSQECRIIRNSIRSFAPDGLYFVVMDKNKKGRYPQAILVDAHIYHYGHVRRVEAMNKKHQAVGKYWDTSHPKFSGYQIDPYVLKPFKGNHPQIVLDWLEQHAEKNYTPSPDYQLTKRDRKHRLGIKLGKLLGFEINKKHFKKMNRPS